MVEPAGFRDFVAARSSALVRSAWLLTGDEAAAEDLVQAALAKTWTRWSRIERQDAPEVYVRRVIVSIFLSWRRRRSYGELVVASVPEAPGSRDAFADVLGCSVGTVKSQNAKALARLRACPSLQDLWTGSEEVHHDAG